MSPGLSVPRWHQDCCHRAAAAIEPRLKHGAGSQCVRVGLELENFGLQQDRVQQLVDVGLLEGRDVNEHRFTAPIFGEKVELGQALLIFSGLAPGLSILFTATMIGTFAACACERASRVCGITPSSAETTRMTMSVTFAPRARMTVNASWPGVSMKVMGLPILLDRVSTDVLSDAAGFARGHIGCRESSPAASSCRGRRDP